MFKKKFKVKFKLKIKILKLINNLNNKFLTVKKDYHILPNISLFFYLTCV